MTAKFEAEFQAATIKTTAKLPLGFTAEIYQRPNGMIQCLWTPHVPSANNRHMRNKVMPAYQAAMVEFLRQHSAELSAGMASS
ncbi:hypothetical protein [Agrobacterium fabrum]|uniref:hypothetical protein n=1 Tax=Agrobacterium fabrum TaxID=1176649 RepID=UPI0021581B02|nr:hypothetical protein [Agrobacterium fabrum]MCR6722798.1 hypothetical protein [Agrobacterium fabrum]